MVPPVSSPGRPRRAGEVRRRIQPPPPEGDRELERVALDCADDLRGPRAEAEPEEPDREAEQDADRAGDDEPDEGADHDERENGDRRARAVPLAA